MDRRQRPGAPRSHPGRGDQSNLTRFSRAARRLGDPSVYCASASTPRLSTAAANLLSLEQQRLNRSLVLAQAELKLLQEKARREENAPGRSLRSATSSRH